MMIIEEWRLPVQHLAMRVSWLDPLDQHVAHEGIPPTAERDGE
jgi:hypothetical protein